MKKICFVFTVNMGHYYGNLAGFMYQTPELIKEFMAQDYHVSTNYLRDKNDVDYLVVPKPFYQFDNERNLPIIEVPAEFLRERRYPEIKAIVDRYFYQVKAA